jgi:hypothetical protein
VPRREKYAPKHRDARPEPALKKGIRKSVVYSGVAVAATGVAVTSGIALDQATPAAGASASLAAAQLSQNSPSQSDTGHPVTGLPSAGTGVQPLPASESRRGDAATTTSRSGSRPPLDPTKEVTLSQQSGGQVTRTADLTSQDPRDIARALLPQYGFSESEFSCLDALYMKESGWDVHADNPTSDAYGIPQALPGTKMATAGPDWANDAATQIRWGLEYIRSSYGTPCGAWDHEMAYNWY